MDVASNRNEIIKQVAQQLLAMPKNTARESWGAIADYSAGTCPKKVANEFLFCCLLEYQIDERRAWNNGCRFIHEMQNDPDDLWALIAGYSKKEWTSETKFKECNLHWMRKPHNRLWAIARSICFHYDGDARRIWQNGDSFDALCRLSYIGAGEQISRMIVGALMDCGYVSGKCDVKADVHVSRVLGRTVFGEEAIPEDAIEIAREIHPANPWQLDSPLWTIGNSFCHPKNPECSECYLCSACSYAHEHSLAS